jgi:hypothetical protein
MSLKGTISSGCSIHVWNQTFVLKNSFPRTSQEVRSRQDALQTTFLVFLDIFLSPRILAILRKWTFSTPQGVLYSLFEKARQRVD